MRRLPALLGELIILGAVTVATAVPALSMFQEATPEPAASAFLGLVTVSAEEGGSPLEVRIHLDTLTGREFAMTIGTLDDDAKPSDTTVHLAGDARLRAETIADLGVSPITLEEGVTQTFHIPASALAGGEQRIIGELLEAPIVRSGPYYDAVLPICVVVEPVASCTIDAGLRPKGHQISSANPESISGGQLLWSAADVLEPQFTMVDQIGLNQLGRTLFIAAGLLGLAAAALLEFLLRLVPAAELILGSAAPPDQPRPRRPPSMRLGRHKTVGSLRRTRPGR